MTFTKTTPVQQLVCAVWCTKILRKRFLALQEEDSEEAVISGGLAEDSSDFEGYTEEQTAMEGIPQIENPTGKENPDLSFKGSHTKLSDLGAPRIPTL